MTRHLMRRHKHVKQDTVNFLLAGFTDAEAARWLGCTRQAVEHNVSALRDEYRAHTRAQLAAMLERQTWGI